MSETASFKVENDLQERTIRLRMTGLLDDVASEAEAERVLAERREQLRNLREGWQEG